MAVKLPQTTISGASWRVIITTVVGIIVTGAVATAGWWLLTPQATDVWRALAVCSAAALSMPVAFIYVRHNVRLQRLRILAQCARVFQMDAPRADPPSPDGPSPPDSPPAARPPSDHLPAERRASPSFEYVVEKYVEDLPKPLRPTTKDSENSRLANEVSKLMNFSEGDEIREGNKISETSGGGEGSYDVDRPWWSLGSSWALFMASLPLVVLSTLGFYVAFAALAPNAAHVGLRQFWEPLLVVGGRGMTGDVCTAATGVCGYRDNVLTVAVVAFVGAYCFSLGTIARAVATFDLSPFSMLRLAVNMVIGVAGAVIAYRGIPDLPGVAPSTTLPRAWILCAFVAGLVPDLIINFLNRQAQDMLGGKATDTSILKDTPSVSPELIDGIDFYIRFRLQQANIYEVQSLAVANPIMLFVETPYGLYQCIDWVAQAQLCTIVGPQRFLMMRRYNLRTIFDVERAILSEYTTSQLRRFVVALMMSPPPARKAAWSFWGGGGAASPTESPPESPPGGDDATAYPAIDTPAFGKYIMDLFCEPAIGPWGEVIAHDPDRTLKHLGRLVVDDLHVHRLRDVWLLVQQRLGLTGDALPDSEKPWGAQRPYGFDPYVSPSVR